MTNSPSNIEPSVLRASLRGSNASVTGWNKKELRNEILHRMSALDSSSEEFTDKELLKDYERLFK